MSGEDLFPLPGVELPAEAEAELTLPRSRQLLAAIARNRDFEVEKLSVLEGQHGARVEFIQISVATDGVPTRNKVGIRYREVLALRVPSAAKALVRVQALRRSFPVLMHQNLTGPDEPRDLCLHFEPNEAVLRDWTAARFLRRVQWWLENSAKGTLHAADQPVEQLFFVSSYELVLPWNFDDLRQEAARKFFIEPGSRRADQGLTFKLVMAADADTKPVSFVHLDLPPVVQGQVFGNPGTLGTLHSLLQGRGVDFVEHLKAAIREFIGDGRPPADDEQVLMVLLSIPTVRAEGGPTERIQRQAYVLSGNLLDLGVKLGVAVAHDGRYYQDYPLGEPRQADEWQSGGLVPAEVLYTNSTAAARKQSGVSEQGPVGTLIGVGSLGSLLVTLWGRMGWGEWTVIDKDHVKPHNLSRHVASAFQIGYPKAVASRQLHLSAMTDASRLTAIEANAASFEDPKVLNALAQAQLVVDASTTLEYPRAASSRDDLARHVSVFLSPNGRDAVLLAEDARRTLRLRTLEAQYYRALIREDFGEDHLAGNNGNFWSGASCRDISAVMPYSQIASHAGNLADQVRHASLQDDARIRIWQRDNATGQVQVRDVVPEPERGLDLDEQRLFFDAGIERRLHELRAANLPNETGGVLLGYYDFLEGIVVIVDAMEAPPDSKSSPVEFERGKEGVASSVDEATRRTGGVVRYLGEWHSHPRGASTRPSTDDRMQIAQLTLAMANDGLPALQLIVGDTDMHIVQGEVR